MRSDQASDSNRAERFPNDRGSRSHRFISAEVLTKTDKTPKTLKWGSDVVAEMLRRLGIQHVAVMPGASFRGMHDSLVNYTENHDPSLLLCIHENTAVGLARGYARATKKPMAVIVHNVVGLLAASMGIFDTWIDRVPMLIIGSTGPVDAAKRRPLIDGMHTANVQGNLVRDFTKWDDQPASVEALMEAILRANRIAQQDPPGPVYVCVTVDIQEGAVPANLKLPNVNRYLPAMAPEAPRDLVARAADALCNARFPVAIVDRVGRDDEAARHLIELAELLSMPVLDQGWGWRGFPSPHALDFTGNEAATISRADVVLGLDCTDLAGDLAKLSESALVINVSSDELLHRGFTAEYQSLPVADIPILANPSRTLPQLLASCKDTLAQNSPLIGKISQRRVELAKMHADLEKRQRAFVESRTPSDALTETSLWVGLAKALKSESFALTMGNSRREAPGVLPSGVGLNRDLSGEAGGAVGMMLPVALGSAIAVSEQGDVPVAVVGDGEFLAGASAIWTAAKYRIPSLIVINNNRSFLSDEHHQKRVAELRGRPIENAWVGMRLEDPNADISGIVSGFGGIGIGPLRTPEEYEKALSAAIQQVKNGACVVLDCWTEDRPLAVFKEVSPKERSNHTEG